MSTLIVGAIIAIIVALAVKSTIKTQKSGGCGCGCEGCGSQCEENKADF